MQGVVPYANSFYLPSHPPTFLISYNIAPFECGEKKEKKQIPSPSLVCIY